jgi:tetratricopeptide (TPR) repeat protein
LRELEQADWPDESEASARLWMLRGELEEALGYPDRAIESYNQGIQVTARLLGRLTILHQRRGLLYHRRREQQSSWQEIHRAEFELAVLRGLVREEEGSYADALKSYQHARDYAEQLNDDSLRAQAERRLAALSGRRQELEAAISHASHAVAIYERMGDRLNLEKMRVNLSFIYVQTRQFAAALEVGKPTYAFFVSVRDPYFAGAAGANLAEASFELGDLDEAARYANEVLALGHRHAMPYAHFTLGQIAIARTDPANAIHQFQESMQLAQQNDDPYMVAYAQRALGQAYQADAQTEAGLQQVREALTLFRQLGIPAEIAATEQLLMVETDRR